MNVNGGPFARILLNPDISQSFELGRILPVAQAFQPAVSPTFKSADRTNTPSARRLENLRYGRLESLCHKPSYEL
jgi:hypothetical protein